MVKAWFGAVLAWLTMSSAALAQERPSDERLALAREVMVLSGGERAFTDMIETLRPSMLQDMRSRGVSAENAERFVRMFVEEFEKEAPQFVELGAIAYANAFTDEELRAIADFLRTPAGRSMVEHQSEISAAMFRAGTIVGEEVGQRVAARMAAAPQPHTP